MARVTGCDLCHSPTTEDCWHEWVDEKQGVILYLCARCHYRCLKKWMDGGGKLD